MDNYNWNNAFPDTPKSFKNKVSATLNSLPDQKENDEMENRKIYKKGSFKKRIMIALVAAMVLGTTVFAAGKVFFINSHGSNIPTYTTMPTAEQVKKDFEFNPKLVKEFDNGYTFANGYTTNNEGLDVKGNSVAKTKSLDFTYKKGNDKLSLSMENGRLGENSEKAIVVNTYNGIDLYYHSYANKLVTGDYKMTEQDKKDELSGKYVFSYGSDKEKISQVQYLNWMQDGINYSFLAMDSNISKDELVKMAQKVIDTK
ncbi:MAG: signal peptide protein [Clostridiaceae bacterium]|nr:signal peptide protein [Clostridiaceae bacterium]